MAITNNQRDLIKMYMASFNRPPEKGGLDYWSAQLAAGKSLAQVVSTVFSLDIVKEIYPDNLPNDAFVTLIYINIFNKIPDDEGLAYWMSQLGGGRERSALVMEMINAGLDTPDGTPGKAFIVNRLNVSQHAVEQQLAKNTEISVSTLKKILGDVTDDPATVVTAKAAINADNAGGLGAPTASLSIAAALNDIGPAEKTAGVAVIVDLTGTRAAAGNTLDILIDGVTFKTPVTRVLTAIDITAQKVTVTIGSLAGWGNDGDKTLSARVRDTAGHIGSAGGDVTVTIDTTAPGAPVKALSSIAAAGGINAAEKAAGTDVTIYLDGTNAAVGDTLTLLLGGLPLTTSVTRVLTIDDVNAQSVTVIVGAAAGWGIDGAKLLTARLTDRAGNVGTGGGTLNVVLDTAAPAITSALAIPAAANGINAAEKAAGMTAAVNLAGTSAAAGDVIDILINGGAFSTPATHIVTAAEVTAKSASVAIAAGDSAWGADGSKILTARLKDGAGNLGNTGGALTVVLDTTGPRSSPQALVIAAGDISAAEKTAGVAVTVNLGSTGAIAGDTVSILIDGAAFAVPVKRVLTAAEITAQSATLTITANAGWGADGNKVLTAQFSDAAGNSSAPGSSVTVLLATGTPGAPASPISIAVAAGGISAAEKTAGVDVVVDLTGTNAIAGTTLTLLIGGVSFATPVTRVLSAADITARSATLTIASGAGWGIDGAKVLSVRLTDTAGNIGTAGASLGVTLDTVAPAITSVLAVPAATNGINAAELAAAISVTVNLAGATVTAGDTVDILIGGAAFTTPVTHVLTAAEVTAKSAMVSIAAADSAWGADGNKILTARLKDVAGNTGTAGGSLTVKLDTVAPTAPTNAVVVAAGDINTAEKTAGVAVVVNLAGTGAIAGDSVSILIDGAAFALPVTRVLTAAEITASSATLTIASASGWGADGTKVLTAQVTDAAGNAGIVGGSFSLQLATAPPPGPSTPIVISAAAAGGINALEKTAGVDAVVNLIGTVAVAGDRIDILVGGVAFATPVTRVLTGGDLTAGNVTLTIPGAAVWGVDGSKTLTARITDASGNVGLPGAAVTFLLDTVAPTLPTAVSVTPVGGTVVANSINSTNTHLTATANVIAGQATGGSAELKIGGVLVATDSTIAAGDTSVTFTTSDGTPDNAELRTALAAGGVATVTVIDAVGNSATSSASTPVIAVNYTGPGASASTLSVATGDISTAERTAGVAVVLSLAGTTAAAGDRVALLLNGAPFSVPVSRVLTTSDITAQSASFTVTSAAGWGVDGSKVLTAVITDASGNVGAPNAGLTIVLDTVAPAAPTSAVMIAVSTNAINSAEKAAGVGVTVVLAGSGAAAGDSVELLIGSSGGVVFTPPVTAVLTSADIVAGTALVTIPSNASWGSDGSKVINARIVDAAGNIGATGGAATFSLDTTAPNPPSSAVAISVAGSGINSAEKSAGVSVVVNLTGVTAVAGNLLELTINGAAFSTPVMHTLSSGELTARSATLTVDSTDGWGADGSKTIGARFIDTAENVGTIGGTLAVTLDSTAAMAVQPPVFTDNTASPATYDASDVILLTVGEAIAVASIGAPVASAGANLGTSMVTAVNPAGGLATQFNLTLSGAGVLLASGDIITLVGVDAAGNQADVAWTLT